MPKIKTITTLSVLIALFAVINCGSVNTDENAIPEGTMGPVITDGIFSPGEWEDSKTVIINENLTMYLKHYGDVFYIGLKCPEYKMPVTDMFITADGTEIYQFHISAQLGEIKFSIDGQDEPEWEFGNTSGWYGNEIRWNYGKSNALVAQGMDNTEAQVSSCFPHEGHEYAFRKDKFGSNSLMIRFEMMYVGHYDKPIIYPQDTEQKNTAGWMKISY
ncbi:MAG: hypothetical protein GY863_20820 [bacterium]|nr:hypothetical protein [bacterium]